MSTVTPCKCPIGIIFYWFTIRSWIGAYYSIDFPILSMACLGKTFASDPKFRITWSISNSLICAVDCISRLVLFLPLSTLCTARYLSNGLPFLVQLSINSCSPSISFWSLRSLMHVYKKDLNTEKSISCAPMTSSSFSIHVFWAFDVEAPEFVKLFFT